MDSKDIIMYVRNLGWNQPQEKQEEAIQVLSEVDEKYYNLIFDKSSKLTWENAVRVVDRIGQPRNKSFISDLLWLLQDINWPGALQAIDVLLKFDKETILPLLGSTIQEAYNQGDYMWLGGLKVLVEKSNFGVSDFGGENTYSLLEFSDF